MVLSVSRTLTDLLIDSKTNSRCQKFNIVNEEQEEEQNDETSKEDSADDLEDEMDKCTASETLNRTCLQVSDPNEFYHNELNYLSAIIKQKNPPPETKV